VSLQALRRVVSELQGLGDGALAGARLVVAGEDVLVAEDQSALSLLRKPGQGVLKLWVDVGDVVRQLRETAAEPAPRDRVDVTG